jgi:hypothetical protein
MLWYEDQLLGNECEINYKAAVAKKRIQRQALIHEVLRLVALVRTDV